VRRFADGIAVFITLVTDHIILYTKFFTCLFKSRVYKVFSFAICTILHSFVIGCYITRSCVMGDTGHLFCHAPREKFNIQMTRVEELIAIRD
jgi:hypothetical protein